MPQKRGNEEVIRRVGRVVAPIRSGFLPTSRAQNAAVLLSNAKSPREKPLRKIKLFGEMAEWLNAAVLKTVKDASPSGVRIPVSPLHKNGLK